MSDADQCVGRVRRQSREVQAALPRSHKRPRQHQNGCGAFTVEFTQNTEGRNISCGSAMRMRWQHQTDAFMDRDGCDSVDPEAQTYTGILRITTEAPIAWDSRENGFIQDRLSPGCDE